MNLDKDLAEFASKKYGQNFLKNSLYIDKIIQAMPNDDLHIVEIGPGLGDLTQALVSARDVTAFEVDERLCEHLTRAYDKFIQNGKLDLQCGDALEHWQEGKLADKPYHLVANLPYYIATRLILKALHDPYCQSILVMVQKEVALKFAATVGEKVFSSLGVLAQSAGEAKLLFEVEPEAFVPPPKVTSAVLSIVKSSSLEDLGFEDFLKKAFAQPRKKLSKNLSQSYNKALIMEAFDKIKLLDNIRPHEVETSAYHQLYALLKENTDARKSKQTKKKPKSI